MTEFSIDFILNRAGERYIGTNASMGVLERIKLHGYHPPDQHQHQHQHQHQQRYHDQHNIHTLASSSAMTSERQFIQLQPQDLQHNQDISLSLPTAPMFDWLHYTRYHPPKLPRSFRAGGLNKRTPGRLPRIPFTPAQLEALEKSYQQSNYLSAEDANKLAESLDLTSTRVKIWYQNRRARERRERREKEESYDSTVSISSNTSSPPASPQPEFLNANHKSNGDDIPSV